MRRAWAGRRGCEDEGFARDVRAWVWSCCAGLGVRVCCSVVLSGVYSTIQEYYDVYHVLSCSGTVSWR